MTYTHTYVEMDVSQAAHDEIRRKLIDARYHHALHGRDGEVLDMHGIALVTKPEKPIAAGTLEVGNDGRNIVVNHPDLKPDANGVGHIVFSTDQAEDFALLLLKNVMELRRKEKPDSGIAVLALGDLDGWTVAAIDDDEGSSWVEQSTGDKITVLRWVHLPEEGD